MKALRGALRSPEPLDLLATVSGLLEVTDHRRRTLFGHGEGQPTLDDLVESFIGASYAETTAALTVIRALTPEELLATRIGRELANRRRPLPGWLTGLEQARVDPDVWFVTHVLGDGEDYLFGVTLPSGHSLSATRRSSAARRPRRAAAAVAWVIARANDTVGGYWSRLTVQDLLAQFGVTGSVSQRAEPLLRANGVDPHRLYGSMKLGAPDLLTSGKRASIIEQRDRHRDESE